MKNEKIKEKTNKVVDTVFDTVDDGFSLVVGATKNTIKTVDKKVFQPVVGFFKDSIKEGNETRETWRSRRNKEKK